jgi:adenylosuccinate synthase
MVEWRAELHNLELQAAGMDKVNVAEVVEQITAAADQLRPHIANTVVYLNHAIAEGKRVLFEGAQGSYLDIDHGTYPFVTSSNTTAGGACTGSGVSPRKIECVIGVAKAYTTRVGSGPFVTESEQMSELLHGMGREFGSTTGRARRCGWLDAVLLRNSVMINGADEIAITNLDGLDGLDRIKICTHYDLDGQRLAYPPATVDEMARCVPVYEEHEGWMQDLSGITSGTQVPAKARAYLDRIAALAGARISLLGIGPAREQTLVLD